MKENMKREYVTRDTDAGGFDYRTIADIMTALGEPMRHSTVRNCINRSMERFACGLMAAHGITGDPLELALDPGFQRNIEEIVVDLYVGLEQRIERLKAVLGSN